MALARAMTHVAPQFDIRIGLAHLNHGLRGRMPTGTRHLFNSLPKPADSPVSMTSGISSAWPVRQGNRWKKPDETRDMIFFRIAEDHGFTRIATGHTRDDNAEQVLMALVRGSGSKGLSGIPAKRNAMIIRPLIDRSRQEIIDFLEALNQAYITDDSNQDPAFLRNRIRSHLLPQLEKDYNPNIRQGLHRLSRILGKKPVFWRTIPAGPLTAV